MIFAKQNVTEALQKAEADGMERKYVCPGTTSPVFCCIARNDRRLEPAERCKHCLCNACFGESMIKNDAAAKGMRSNRRSKKH